MKFKINRELTEKEIQDAVLEKYPGAVKMGCKSVGDALGGDDSAVRTYMGTAEVGKNGVAMGTSVELGENSVGAILNEKGEIIKIKIKINGELKTIWEI